MLDQFGRKIEYMRLSMTERCNLRCRYCMPNGIELSRHDEMLTLEEQLRICAAAVELGIKRFKITGGEPLVRLNCMDFIARLKAMPGVEQVTLTTNALLLKDKLDALAELGIDGINISLDSLDEVRYRELTGSPSASPEQVLSALDESVRLGIKTKLNAVLLEETFDEITALAALSADRPLDVRFIELMPIGEGTAMRGVPMEAALSELKLSYPDLAPVNEKRGNGPARYYASKALRGRIGFIDAVSHEFCSGCNRVRLTASGVLKPCLCYEMGASIRDIIRSGCTNEQLREAMRDIIAQKPRAHSFSQPEGITERKSMNQIGG